MTASSNISYSYRCIRLNNQTPFKTFGSCIDDRVFQGQRGLTVKCDFHFTVFKPLLRLAAVLGDDRSEDVNVIDRYLSAREPDVIADRLKDKAVIIGVKFGGSAAFAPDDEACVFLLAGMEAESHAADIGDVIGDRDRTQVCCIERFLSDNLHTAAQFR